MEEYNYSQSFSESNTRISDLEERQRLLKERVLLIGQNLIEARESLETDLLQLKDSVEDIKKDIKKMKSLLLRVSDELEKKARKSELELVQKQMKMFDPYLKK